MKFAKIIGLPLSIVGLILYFPPLQRILTRSFGEAGPLTAAVIFASGWALLLGYLVFNLGMKSQKRRHQDNFE